MAFQIWGMLWNYRNWRGEDERGWEVPGYSEDIS